MDHDNAKTVLEEDSNENLRQSRRDRWAPTLAAGITAIHFLAGAYILGWYYFIVPRFKYELDQSGARISQAAVMVIRQSDTLVSYWYLLLLIGPPILVIDFLIARWIAKEMGVSRAIIFGCCVTMILLIQSAYGQYVLK